MALLVGESRVSRARGGVHRRSHCGNARQPSPGPSVTRLKARFGSFWRRNHPSLDAQIPPSDLQRRSSERSDNPLPCLSQVTFEEVDLHQQ
mgnify:CR=1 FL=1